MKNLKLPFLLSLLFVFTSCGYRDSYYMKECRNKIDASERVGVAEALERIKTTAFILLGEVVNSKDTIVKACEVVTCHLDYAKLSFDSKKYASENPSLSSLLSYDGEKRDVCIPYAKKCPDPSNVFGRFLGLDYGNVFEVPANILPTQVGLSSLDAARYDLSACGLGGEEDPGDEEPEGCTEGFVYSEAEEACVQNETSCTESELLGIGAATGYKVYSDGLGEYGICQALTCSEGYTLGLGICNPTIPAGPAEVMGCMDNRAVNFNPLATETDMSCVCDFGTIYNPIFGCSEPE